MQPTIEQLKAMPEAATVSWDDDDYDATVFWLTLLWLCENDDVTRL